MSPAKTNFIGVSSLAPVLKIGAFSILYIYSNKPHKNLNLILFF